MLKTKFTLEAKSATPVWTLLLCPMMLQLCNFHLFQWDYFQTPQKLLMGFENTDWFRSCFPPPHFPQGGYTHLAVYLTQHSNLLVPYALGTHCKCSINSRRKLQPNSVIGLPCNAASFLYTVPCMDNWYDISFQAVSERKHSGRKLFLPACASGL